MTVNVPHFEGCSAGNEESRQRYTIQNLALLTIIGFAVRILVAQMFLGGLDRGYDGDEGDYVRLATALVHGIGFVDKIGNPTSFWSPGLPLIVALPVSLFGANIVAVRIFMCFIESLLVPACYFLGYSVSGSRQLGFIAGGIAVVFPTWIIPSGAVLTDVTAAIFVTLMAWMLIEGCRRQSLESIVAAGIIWGIATLVRPVSLGYIPGVVLWVLLVMPGWKRPLLSVAALLVGFASILAPWVVRNTSVHGTVVLTSTQGGTELYKSNNPEATGILAIDHARFRNALEQRYPPDQYPNEALRSNRFQADAITFIVQNPARFAELCAIRFVQLWKLYSPRVPWTNSFAVIGSFGIALPFFLIQLIRCRRQRGPHLLILLVIFCHTAVHMVFTAVVRYRIPIEPLVIVVGIQGFDWAFGRLRYNAESIEDPKLRVSSVSR